MTTLYTITHYNTVEGDTDVWPWARAFSSLEVAKAKVMADLMEKAADHDDESLINEAKTAEWLQHGHYSTIQYSSLHNDDEWCWVITQTTLED